VRSDDLGAAGEAVSEGTPGERFLDMLLRLSDGLRASGVDVSLGEVLDAAVALQHLGVADRLLLRSGLQSVLVKRPEDVAPFLVIFDQCFATTTAAAAGQFVDGGEAAEGAVPGITGGLATPGPTGGGGRDAGETIDVSTFGTDLLDALLRALRAGDDAALRALASQAVDAYSGIGATQGGERYFLYRVLRALDLSKMIAAAMREARLELPDAADFELRQERAAVSFHLEEFRQMLAAEIRARLHHDVARSGVGLVAPRRLEDTDVSRASRAELREMRRVVRPLARKLASRVSERRRRHHRGRLDVRRTMRRSLVNGGVPLDPRLRRKRPTKPSIVVLCDISGSVAEFAHFTLMLLHALQSELAGLRSFVFVDGVAEVTRLLEKAEVDLDPRLLVTLPGVVAGDGHSDYQEAFDRFLREHGSVVTPATTVLVTGDGRTNYRATGVEPFRELCERARHVYWFNPDREDEWGQADSALPLYGELCDEVFEVRNLTQLADAVASIL
jgi:hypothetical protein